VNGLPFGGPLGLSYEEKQQTAAALRAFIDDGGNRKLLHLDPDVEYRIPSFHPLYRMNRDGSVRWDLAVEVVQTTPAAQGVFPLRGGTTLIISTHSTGGGGLRDDVFVRYVISKPLGGKSGERRAQLQKEYLAQLGIRADKTPAALRINFALVHGGA
jgi:hypothetical protein